MSAKIILQQQYPRVYACGTGIHAWWRNLGDQARFYIDTLASLPLVFGAYRGELLRQVAGMSLGTGALAVIGGTVAVVSFLTMSTGGIIAAQGYNQFSQVGIEALTGFASAFLNPRVITPTTASIALAATVGAGATAQLGAMRINEEIDALEVMGIRAIGYLATTRVVGGVIVVVPLYCVAILLAFLAARFGTTAFYGQSTGVYDHYFTTFLIPGDVLRSFVVTLIVAGVVMLVHTYYGFNAKGGPAGVGEAVGRATRTSLIGSAFVVLLVTMGVYGQTGNFHFAG